MVIISGGDMEGLKSERGPWRVPEEVKEFSDSLRINHRVNYKAESGVMACGMAVDDENELRFTVFVAKNTNLSDEEMFPKEVNGIPIQYAVTDIPVAY